MIGSCRESLNICCRIDLHERPARPGFLYIPIVHADSVHPGLPLNATKIYCLSHGANIQDIVFWIGNKRRDDAATVFEFGEDFRPCKLTRYVVGVPRQRSDNDFSFARKLACPLRHMAIDNRRTVEDLYLKGIFRVVIATLVVGHLKTRGYRSVNAGPRAGWAKWPVFNYLSLGQESTQRAKNSPEFPLGWTILSSGLVSSAHRQLITSVTTLKWDFFDPWSQIRLGENPKAILRHTDWPVNTKMLSRLMAKLVERALEELLEWGDQKAQIFS
ncbi:hypothetical protein B0H19DRAFT_1077794 [Mycena capillaripes]|nr:hypothetical protein B0H19DRAFT_1077794 [Mycena capillaripes]